MEEVDFEKGDIAYLPDGRCGEVLEVTRHLNGMIEDVLVQYPIDNRYFKEDWFGAENLNRLSVNERLRRIEKRLGIDE